MSITRIKGPYLLFLGAVRNPLDAKTGRGLKDWRPELCLGQSRLPGCSVDLGLPDMTPAQAYAAGARSLVIGVAPLGGDVSPEWVDTLVEALEAGLDLVSGMHSRLGNVEELRQAADRNDRALIDIRVPPVGIPLATGQRRRGKRMLMVGTDCCVGKKYSALALHRALEQRGATRHLPGHRADRHPDRRRRHPHGCRGIGLPGGRGGNPVAGQPTRTLGRD